ncbi:MAG: putative ATPase, partial [Mycobacterium sp.]|nr:putative ATPase [Mycobacterium sp.]
AAVNRRELPPIAPDLVSIDHRRAAAFAPGEGIAYIRAGWDLDQSTTTYIEQVHRLNDFGAVYTHAGHGVSNQGFDAEWRGVDLLTVEDDMVNRCEVFDETDLDAALARFEELRPQERRLENAATKVEERFQAYFAARDWAAMGEILADDISADDRRRVVNAGIRHGRDAKIADMRATADLGTKNGTSIVIAIRGQRLALVRIRLSGRDQRPDAFHTEMLGIAEINADHRMAARVLFDVDDIDAAFEELDNRYLAGEAADHAQTWSVITRAFAAVNRHEVPPTAPDWVDIDHRRGAPFGHGDLAAIIATSGDITPDLSNHVECVHLLNDFGALFTQISYGSSYEGFGAEWRMLNLVTIEGDLMNRCELFDESDIDAALARFDELTRPAPQLQNAANQVLERYFAHFAAREWDAMAETLADDFMTHDRRRVVNAGVRHGRAAEIANMQAFAEIGTLNITLTVVATRGERLVLVRDYLAIRDWSESESSHDGISVIEINADNRISAHVLFDADSVDAAFDELDARYTAGEATPHAHTWSVIAKGYGAFNRRELLATTPQWENVDHRRGAAFAPGDMIAYINAAWDDSPDTKIYIAAVHRLSNLGGVVTHVAHGISQEGFDAEWRDIHILTVEGQAFSRCELFDETDLDAALVRFDELSRPAPSLENAASRIVERLQGYFAGRDWHAMAESLSDDICTDDRRRVVGAGIRHGRDAEIASMRATAEVGTKNITGTVMATRGNHLVLSQVRLSGRHQGADTFLAEALGVIATDADGRIGLAIVFDPDDFDAAFAELDARYAAGEAAEHSHTWSVVAGAFAAVNRHDLPEMTPDWVNVDHRRAASFAPGELAAYTRATWEQLPDVMVYVEAVHRLTDFGAVVTQMASGTSQEGFHAEWHESAVYTVEDDRLSRCELFDEADINAALAKFDELSRPAPRLENSASQVYGRLNGYFAARDWAAAAESMAKDMCDDDRRRVVNAGIRRGRDAVIANLRTAADLGAKNITSTAIAIRGDRLALCRLSLSGRGPEAFHTEVLGIVEIDVDERFVAHVMFDPEDIDAGFAELDARYVVGEATAYAQTWSVIARGLAAFNRRELPGFTPDSVNIDHRRARGFAPGDLTAYIGATWDLAPDVSAYAEAVHRLSNLGAVWTHAVSGTSQDGFDAEWREICLATVEGDLINRIEMFEEEDIDAALARFDELNRPAHRLENAASRMYYRFNGYLMARDWDAMAEMVADDICNDDRRRVVSSGVLRGRDAQTANLRAVVDVGVKNFESVVIATRGERVALMRTCVSGGQLPEAFGLELLTIIEIDSDNRISWGIQFDAEDIDAAVEELDARYLAGEAAEHSHTWSLIARACAAFNRHVMPPTTSDWINVDHRKVTAFAPGDMTAYMRATFGVAPDIRFYFEAVHRLTDLGAVFTQAGRGISHEGFEAEWRDVILMSIEGDQFNRCEIFDEADLDAALARFDELSPPAP